MFTRPSIEAIQYHLLTAKRFKGLIPSVPWKLLNAYKKPVFLESMFKVFSRSKIVLNMLVTLLVHIKVICVFLSL